MKKGIKVKLLGLGLIGCMSLGLMGCSTNNIANEIDEKVESIIQSNVEERKYDYENNKMLKTEEEYYENLCKVKDIKAEVEEGENIYTIKINLLRNNNTSEEFTIETLDKSLEDIKDFDDVKVIEHREYKGDELIYGEVLHGYEHLEGVENDTLNVNDEDSMITSFKMSLGFDCKKIINKINETDEEIKGDTLKKDVDEAYDVMKPIIEETLGNFEYKLNKTDVGLNLALYIKDSEINYYSQDELNELVKMTSYASEQGISLFETMELGGNDGLKYNIFIVSESDGILVEVSNGRVIYDRISDSYSN